MDATNTDTPDTTLGLQTFIVRIYRPRDPKQRVGAVSGTVERIPGGGTHAFDGIRQLGALLALTGAYLEKPAKRRK